MAGYHVFHPYRPALGGWIVKDLPMGAAKRASPFWPEQHRISLSPSSERTRVHIGVTRLALALFFLPVFPSA